MGPRRALRRPWRPEQRCSRLTKQPREITQPFLRPPPPLPSIRFSTGSPSQAEVPVAFFLSFCCCC